MTKTQGRLKTVLGPVLNQSWVEVKVKFTLEQATKAQRRSAGIVILLHFTSVQVKLYYFINLGARWRWVVTPRHGRFTPGK
jgi:hypothetical protein